MPTLKDRHRVKNLPSERKKLNPAENELLDRLTTLGVLEDKALRAVKERGLTKEDVDKNLELGRPPHWVETVHNKDGSLKAWLRKDQV